MMGIDSGMGIGDGVRVGVERYRDYSLLGTHLTTNMGNVYEGF